MDETHAIDEALPTAGADDDQAASPGPIATGPTPPTQFRRAARRPLPTAIKLVEDMMPRDLFIAGVMGGGYLLPSNYPSLAVVNRSFNDTMCQPRVILFRGMTAWTSERVRELTAADPPHEHFIQTLWVMQATGQLTEEIRSRNPTLVQAWDLAEANPPPPQLQAMLAALAAQHLNAAEAA